MSAPDQYPESWPFPRDDFDALDMFYSMKHAWQRRQAGEDVDVGGHLAEIGARHGVYGDERAAINDLAFTTVYGFSPEHTSETWTPEGA